MRLNIVIPVYNEDEKVLRVLQQLVSYLNADDALVVVDASDHDVNNFLSNFICQQDSNNMFYVASEKGRALQMNAGVEFLLSQRGCFQELDLLWFLHCDSGVSDAHFKYLRALAVAEVWGRFDVELSSSDFPFPIISKFINVRSRITQVMTGDQGIFIRSDIFQQLRGYANIPLMEDIEISKRLRKIKKAQCDGPVLQTSARRWQQQGWAKTILLMWQLRLKYWLGISPDVLVKKYYK